MKKLLDFFKKEFANDAIDLKECLQLLGECMDGTVQNIAKKANTAFANRDFEKMNKYQQCVTEIDALQVKLESFMALLDFDDCEEEAVELLGDAMQASSDKQINYADYAVDESTEHSLIEDFTHKRPAAFRLSGTRIAADDWKKVYVFTCEELAKTNPAIFRGFLSDPTMQGKKVEYFSATSTGMRNPAFIKSAKVYATTNLSANSIRSMIQKMLKRYSIPMSDYKVYFKADYSALHAGEKRISNSENISADETKIGKYVRLSLRDLAEKGHCFSEQDLLNLQSKEWSKNTLGIDFPLLKKFDAKMDLSEQIKEGSYNRYWKELFDFNGETYLATSQWFDGHRALFDKWLNSIS